MLNQVKSIKEAFEDVTCRSGSSSRDWREVLTVTLKVLIIRYVAIRDVILYNCKQKVFC
jgi:hypothetical protein